MSYTAYERAIPTSYRLENYMYLGTDVGYSESKMGALLCSPPTNQPTDYGTLHVPTYPPDLPDLPVSPNTCT